MADTDQLTRLNTALTGRYSLERELGRGGMDQTIVAHASAGGALLFETDSGARRKVPLGFRTWILPTGVDHSLADGGYNARRAECERALEICRRRLPDLTALARLDPEALEEVMHTFFWII